MCGFIKLSHESPAEHMQTHHSGFQSGRQKTCRYFMRGHCIKGENCVFRHPNLTHSRVQRNEYISSAADCRNGSNCRYLRMGVCKFNHNLRANHDQRPQNNVMWGRNWCQYGDTCTRKQFCSLIHPSQVFPLMNQTNHPPRNRQMQNWGRI